MALEDPTAWLEDPTVFIDDEELAGTGRIWVRSRLGEGATFTAALPIGREE